MEQNPTSFGAADRKTIEKNRRNYMKDLYSKLHSLVPRENSSKGVKSLTVQLDEAAKYIRKLKLKLEKLKHKRETLEGINLLNYNIPRVEEAILESACIPPQVDVHDSGSSVEIHLISGLDASSFMFIKIVRMLQEEGFEIQNANCVVSNGRCFQTIHSQLVRDCVSSCGSGTISERIKKFVNAR